MKRCVFAQRHRLEVQGSKGGPRGTHEVIIARAHRNPVGDFKDIILRSCGKRGRGGETLLPSFLRAEPPAESQQCKLRAAAKTLGPDLNDAEIKTNSKMPASEYRGRKVSFTYGVTTTNKALPAFTLGKSR